MVSSFIHELDLSQDKSAVVVPEEEKHQNVLQMHLERLALYSE